MYLRWYPCLYLGAYACSSSSVLSTSTVHHTFRKEQQLDRLRYCATTKAAWRQRMCPLCGIRAKWREGHAFLQHRQLIFRILFYIQTHAKHLLFYVMTSLLLLLCVHGASGSIKVKQTKQPTLVMGITWWALPTLWNVSCDCFQPVLYTLQKVSNQLQLFHLKCNWWLRWSVTAPKSNWTITQKLSIIIALFSTQIHQTTMNYCGLLYILLHVNFQE